LVTDLPADFEVFGQAVATSMADLLGGTTGQILAKASATDMDFAWIANDQGDITGITAGTGISVTSPTGPVPTVAIDTAVTVDKTTAQTLTNKTLTSPALTTPTISTATTNGDLLYGTGSGALTRLGIGSTSQVLTVAGGVPTWATPAGGGGKVLQVVNVAYSTISNSTSGTYTDTGLTATITPTLNTSKILVLVNHTGVGISLGNEWGRIQLLRDGSAILLLENFGAYNSSASLQNYVGSVSTSYLDSPATTSATIYKTQFNRTGGTFTINQGSGGTGSSSTITLMEIGA
jgi:hypothetical protein